MLRRIESDELLDAHDAPAADVEQSLRDLRRINAFAGGTAAYKRLLRRMVSLDEPLAVLDLGTGTSDLLEALPRVRRIGLDFKIQHLAIGAAWERCPVTRVTGNAFHLPFRDRSVDVVTSSHFFHHFSPEANVAILRESLRVARTGVAITDTRRHIAPYAFIRTVSALRLVGRITRFDGPASVMQGYTLHEVRDVAARCGARTWRVFRLMPYRFGLLLWK